MPSVRANGLDVDYIVDGAGPPLVLLHGASSSGAVDFAAQIPHYRKAFRCYAPDARGHAATRWDAADGFRYAWLVDDLEAFADVLGLRRSTSWASPWARSRPWGSLSAAPSGS